MTMIYTVPQAERLAEQAVVTAEVEAKGKQIELTKDEKDRIWKITMDACIT